MNVLGRGTWLTRAAIGIWLVAVTAGFLWSVDYDARPASGAAAPQRWPAASRLEHPRRSPMVLMFVHPKCPCTRAGLAELARIKQEAGDALSVQLVLIDLPQLHVDWKQARVWPSVMAVKGAKLWFDRSGAEARRFGAKTSGFTLVYDPDGRLTFSGGITEARGHFGANLHSDALAVAVTSNSQDASTKAQPASTPVYGCPLFDPSSDRCKAERQ